MRKRALLILTLFISVLSFYFFLFPDSNHAAKRFDIKFATVAPEGSTWVKKIRYLDKRLDEKSNGQIRIKIYAGGIAGDELDVLKKIRIGQIHCAAFSGAGIAQILPMARILDLPFLFRDREEIDSVQKALTPYFAEQFRESGFEFLSWAEVGDVYLFSKKPIQRKADLIGRKVWTWTGDPVSKMTFSAMGTNPIPISITEVTTALNTNMIDTVYAPPLGALALQWHHYVNYMTSFPITHATAVVLISLKYFKSIPDKLSDLLKAESNIIMADLTSELIQQNGEAIRIIRESGVNITPPPSESELEEFYGIHNRVAQELAGVVYPKELLNRVYEILGRANRIQ